MPSRQLGRIRLHLDADASQRALHRALVERGHDVTRTPAEWMPGDADDRAQLLGATAQGRCVFTFNIRDFIQLSQVYVHHAGILLAAQQSWSLSALIGALDRFLSAVEAEACTGQVLWLNAWRSAGTEK